MYSFVHTAMQPYNQKCPKHNLLQSIPVLQLWFCPLAMLTYYNYKYNINDGTYAACVQLVLLSLPIAYIICYTAVVAYKKYFPNRLHNNFSRVLSRNSETTSTADDELPARLLAADDDATVSIKYKTLLLTWQFVVSLSLRCVIEYLVWCLN